MADTSGGVGISYNQEFEVIPPAREQVIGVSLSQWKRFMARIEECSRPTPTFDSIGWGCLGFAASALFSALTFPASVNFIQKASDGQLHLNAWALFTELFCAATAVGCTVAGVVSLLFARTDRRRQSSLQARIVEDMKFLEEKHTAPAAHIVTGTTRASTTITEIAGSELQAPASAGQPDSPSSSAASP